MKNMTPSNIKKVDCALIFMLDEERDYFLKFNNQFIFEVRDFGKYIEFTFFDKLGYLRKGVICSNGTAMGNTESCSLFYKLSREYTADLYINLGVSGVIKDVNIGDVVVVTRLSTLGEENATGSPWQLKDVPVQFADDAENAAMKLHKFFSNFSESTKEGVLELKNELKKIGKESLCSFDFNTIKTGWCGTVPEVIKGEKGRENFPIIRKLNIIDMEAYYLVLWHSLIKKTEPEHSSQCSEILVFKSASDNGDENKQIMEDCGSRKLAMTNLSNVVTKYCTEIHDFPRNTNETIFTFFNNEVKKSSADEFAEESSHNFDKTVAQFEKLCSYFIETDEDNFDKNQCVKAAFESLSTFNKAIFLCGRSGTAKSTFMSYLYYLVLKNDLKAVLVDFSKYTESTNPKASQLVYLMEKLLYTESDLYIFLDGIDISAPYYNHLLSVLDKDNYTNISYCIGDIIGSNESINIIPQHLNSTTIEFSGKSLYSDDFDVMLESAEQYFKILKRDLSAIAVKEFVAKSKITNVDFRLLSMISNHCDVIANCSSLYTFLNKSIIKKFGRSTLLNYRESPYLFCADRPSDLPVEFMKFNHNTYANSLAVAQEIVDMFEKNDRNRILKFATSKFVLSDDMNLFLNHLLKYNRKSNDIIDNIIDTLTEDKNISVCVQTQLLYSISGVVKIETTQYDKLKQLLINKVKIAKSNSIASSDYPWMIQYRTLCIVLNQYFNISDYLSEYNKSLLNNNLISKYNLYYHFLYYSKCPFTFDHINRFNIEFLNHEVFLNTYYVLKRFIDNDLQNKLLSRNPFVFMNIITYMNLIREVIIKENKFLYLSDEIKTTIDNIGNTITMLKSHPLPKDIMEQIEDLALVINQKLFVD